MRVVYHSFEGRYSDSPRALYEAWQQRRPGDTHTWLADPAHLHGFPIGVDTVLPYDERCIDALESADLLIANTHTDVDWNKRQGAVYLQTWHGTALKRIHYDLLWSPPGKIVRLTRDVDRWDILVSPNAVSTDTQRRAFAFSGEVIETGYPRNDMLSSPDRESVRRRVRRELELSDDITVVLYTPTFRDDAVFAPDRPDIELGLSVEDLAQELGPAYCVLLRLHYLATDRRPPVRGAGIRDVSYFPEIAELYLAADAMVTDYSSTMFDFAVTGKPLLFFAYDLERYRDELRGFYFDFERYAPGPIVRTPDELADALLHLDAVRQRCEDRYASFQQTYCPLDDGHATDRVLDRLWCGPEPGREPETAVPTVPHGS
jgi:CDP-glycerol glycerophosphotransferase